MMQGNYSTQVANDEDALWPPRAERDHPSRMWTVSGARMGEGILRQSLFLHTLPLGGEGFVERLELPEGAAQRLQELGFVPGSRVKAAWSAPGGDPRVYRVDGAEIALRKETASRIVVTTSWTGDRTDVAA